MNLRTSLQVSAVFPIVLALMVSLSLILRSRQVGEEQRVFRSVENLTRAAAELHVATFDGLLRRNAEASDIWMKKHAAIVAAVDAVQVDSVAGQIVLDRSREEVKRLKDTFTEYVAQPDAEGKGGDGARIQLAADSDTLMQNAFELARMVDANAEERQGNADMFFAVFIGVMGLLMAAAILSVSRDVVRRLDRLNQWARAMSDGVLDATIDAGGRNDEVGQMARACSDMTRKLAAAHETMEKEIAEHKRIADALRESNALLSNALEKLKRAQHQIVQQERLHVLEQIVRGVAHDFNNTLTPILGMSDFLIAYPQYLDDHDKVLDNMKSINEAARRARNDVKKLSEFFQPAKGSAAHAVDMNDAVTGAVQLTETRWKRPVGAGQGPITVRTELGVVPPAAGDRASLLEGLANLILNSVEAMPRGGQIAISTRFTGDAVIVDVRDSGEGMTDDVRDPCLEPFYSTKGVEGTGTGLTIVNNAVRRYGGTLDIRSQKGRGTTVTISLPAWKERRSASRGTEVPLPAVRALRVLVIDDDPWSRDIVAKILRSDGHQVDVAGAGREGVEKTKTGGFELVITDQVMPDMAGDEVATEIRKMRPQVPIILLSGFGDIMIEEGNKPDNVDVIVSKPVTMRDLSDAISRALSFRR